MEGEIQCTGGSDCHHTLYLCNYRTKTSIKIFFILFLETPASPWNPFRVTFRPLGRFCPSRPLAYSLRFIPRVRTGKSVSGLQIRVRIGKLFSLVLNQNICCGYSMRRFFCAPKTMFKLMGKKIITILRS